MITETYHFTSTQFKGVIVLRYNTDGALVSQDLTGADLNVAQINWFNNTMPKYLAQFQSTLKSNPSANKNTKLTKITTEKVTFEQFWNKYNEKTRSSKKKALNCWNRLSQTDRDRAYNYIATYERNIPNGIAKKYAETYLNAELWNN